MWKLYKTLILGVILLFYISDVTGVVTLEKAEKAIIQLFNYYNELSISDDFAKFEELVIHCIIESASEFNELKQGIKNYESYVKSDDTASLAEAYLMVIFEKLDTSRSMETVKTYTNCRKLENKDETLAGNILQCVCATAAVATLSPNYHEIGNSAHGKFV